MNTRGVTKGTDSSRPVDPYRIYRWLLVAACFTVTMMLGDALFAHGVFFKPLEDTFGWSREEVSSGFTAFMVGFGISAAVSGRLADRYSPRPILFVSASIAGLGTALCSVLNSVFEMRLFLFIAGLGAGATLAVPTATLQRWFYGRRDAGMALAVVMAGTAVGQMLLAPLTNWLIQSYDWRNAYLITGVVFFVAIFSSTIVIKRAPADAAGRPATGAKPVAGPQWSTRKALATPAYMGIIFAATVASAAFQVVAVHLVPFATDFKMSPTAAAVALGVVGGGSLVGRIICGYLSGRVGWRTAFALSEFVTALSLAWLLIFNTWGLFAFALIFGAANGARIVGQVGIVGDFFGMRSVGELVGITAGICTLVGAGAPYLAGYIFDATRSYFAAFALMAAICLAGAIGLLLIKKPAEPGQGLTAVPPA